MVQYGNYLYFQHDKSNMRRKKRWICRRRNYGCKASITTIDDHVVYKAHDHNHYWFFYNKVHVIWSVFYINDIIILLAIAGETEWSTTSKVSFWEPYAKSDHTQNGQQNFESMLWDNLGEILNPRAAARAQARPMYTVKGQVLKDDFEFSRIAHLT